MAAEILTEISMDIVADKITGALEFGATRHFLCFLTFYSWLPDNFCFSFLFSPYIVLLFLSLIWTDSGPKKRQNCLRCSKFFQTVKLRFCIVKSINDTLRMESDNFTVWQPRKNKTDRKNNVQDVKFPKQNWCKLQIRLYVQDRP